MATAFAPTQAGPAYEQLDPEQRAHYLTDKLEQIASRLQKVADDAVSKKSPVETRWVDDLRSFHGKYDPTTETSLKEAEKSMAFVKITRKKTNSWEARLSSLLFPTDEENWDAIPTPLPTLAQEAAQATDAARQQLDQANAVKQQQPESAEGDEMAGAAQQMFEVANALEGQIGEAKKRCEAMKKEMRDQLVECDYASHCRMVIRDACRLGTGVLKGPMSTERQRGQWVQIDGQGFQYQRGEDPAPRYRWVDPWSYFPDPSAIRPEDREFDLERHLWSAKDLRRLVREAGFNPDAVRELLSEDRRLRAMTDAGMGYLINLRAITGVNETITGRYVGWEYHGPLETQEVACILRGLGQDAAAEQYEKEDDPLQEVRVIVYFCEGKILKMSPAYPLDSQESLYSIFTFEPAEGSLFGYGIPYIMGDSQKAMNGAWRMALDNAGLSVGPQIFIDRDSIEPANRRWKLEPRKIWYKKKGSTVSGQVFEVANVPNNVKEIMTIVETARRFIDDETALPVQAEGEMTDNPNITATATNFMSMASNITFRRVVKAYDDGITVTSIRRLYDWNMQHNAREEIKGDLKVDARGSTVLLMRELQSAMLFAVAQNWPSHPVLGQLVKPYEAAAAALKSAMIQPEDIMPTRQEYEAAVTAAQKAAEENQPQDPAIVAAQARLQAAQVDAQSRVQVASMQREVELMRMAQLYNLEVDKLAAMLGLEYDKLGHKERMLIAEGAMEQELAKTASTKGEERKGSGGSL